MDNLDELLAVRPPDDLPIVHERLRTQTARIIGRRRWRIMARRGLALAACFVAGAFAYRWLGPAPQPEVVVVTKTLPPATAEKPRPTLVRVESPELTERWASLAEGDRRAGLYRRAGDGFLARGDEPAALRCYRKSLDSTLPNDLVIQPNEDSWLLMTLKVARQKESKDARN